MKNKRKHLIGIICVVVIAIIILITLLAFFKNTRQYQKHLDNGQNYMNELKYEQAVVEFELAIEIDPDRSEAYIPAAKANVLVGNYDVAINVLTKGYERTANEDI